MHCGRNDDDDRRAVLQHAAVAGRHCSVGGQQRLHLLEVVNTGDISGLIARFLAGHPQGDDLADKAPLADRPLCLEVGA